MRHAVGDAPLADLDAAQARLAAAEASLPGIRARERAAGFALAVLLGAPPEYGLQLLQGAPGLPALAEIPVGERADLLRRRPDVVAAAKIGGERSGDRECPYVYHPVIAVTKKTNIVPDDHSMITTT